MLQSMSLPLCENVVDDPGDWSGLRLELEALGLNGIEGIWGGGDIPAGFPGDLLVGYHLTFFPDWLDFYRDDRSALRRKFGTLDAAWRFYGGKGPETLLDLYRADLERALSLGASYVVFHVSDISLEESYTYRWLHTNEEVIDASAEVINTLLAGIGPGFDFLVENQWWPGFTFTEPAQTARLLEAIAFPRKGIMLDTGHLMNTNTRIANQKEGISYILDMLERHGELSRMIRGVHLHQSVSGAYVRSHTGSPPPDLPEDYIERFQRNYAHIQRIDRHRPWTDPDVAKLLERIRPDFLTHELYAETQKARLRAVKRQMNTQRKGKDML